MRLTKETTIQITKTIGVICDCCGKSLECDHLPRTWHEFSSHHSGWGNDSLESCETTTVCSPECYIKKLKDETQRIEEYKHYPSEVGEFDVNFSILLCKYLAEYGI